ISTIFCRYTTDDFAPGEPWTDPRFPGREITRSMLGEAGRNRTVQKDGTVLVAYQSKSQFIGEYKALRLTIVVPVIYRSVRRIRVGEEEVQLPYRSAKPDVVWLEDDFFYSAFKPLMITDRGRADALRIEERDGYLSINFINYEGPWKKFGQRDLLSIQNGFVAEIGGRSEYGSFRDFRRKAAGGHITDEVASNQRSVSYSREGVQLGLSYSLVYGGLKYTVVDGTELPSPAFQATGVTFAPIKPGQV
ncbi:MAG: hypothetical protein ABI165_02330, partial [Bryobacteraceae bacterium]